MWRQDPLIYFVFAFRLFCRCGVCEVRLITLIQTTQSKFKTYIIGFSLVKVRARVHFDNTYQYLHFSKAPSVIYVGVNTFTQFFLVDTFVGIICHSWQPFIESADGNLGRGKPFHANAMHAMNRFFLTQRGSSNVVHCQIGYKTNLCFTKRETVSGSVAVPVPFPFPKHTMVANVIRICSGRQNEIGNLFEFVFFVNK